MAARSVLRLKQVSRILPTAQRLSVKRNFYVNQRALGDAEENFKAAKERLSTLKEEPGNEVKLKLYGLFKQVRYFIHSEDEVEQ